MSAKHAIPALLLAMLVSACSSDVTIGGSGLNAIGYKIKQLAFSWPSVVGADTYRLLENPDGVSGYSQIGTDFPATTLSYDYDIAVHLHDWSNASYILQWCISGSCTDSTARMATNSSAAIGYFKASNTGFNDQFGQAVAVSDDGSTVAVGAWAEDSNSIFSPADNSFPDAGAVYVFDRTAGAWQGPVYLKADLPDSGDQFGYSVALSSDGSTLAVGAWQEAGNGTSQSDNSAAGAGAVYVFVRSAGVWSQQAYLKASNVEAADHFGQAVTLSDDGNTLAVGAPGESSNGSSQADNSAPGAGAVYTFTRSGGVWSQQAYLKASNAAANAGFGNALSLSAGGKVLAVAASLEDDGVNTNNGAAYVFSYATAWSETALLRASNAGTNDNFGTSLVLSADGATLAAGAPYEDSDGTGYNNNALDSGAVYLYTNTTTGWSQQAMLKAALVEAGDQFGFSVALGSSGDILGVGANREDGATTGVGGDPQDNSAIWAGAGYAFTRAAGLWTQHAYLKASNTQTRDSFGSAMAMSADGLTLAVGANNEDSSATGIGGDQTDNGLTDSGAVYLY